MKLTPILTEKSLKDAKEGKFAFWVDNSYTKFQVRKLISDSFGVVVKKVRIAKKGENFRKTHKGPKFEKEAKKAIVALKEGQKIDLFEEKK